MAKEYRNTEEREGAQLKNMQSKPGRRNVSLTGRKG
jgi:hypothetical protein